MDTTPVTVTHYIDGKVIGTQILGYVETASIGGTFHLNSGDPSFVVGRPFVSSGPSLQQPPTEPKPATEAQTIHLCSHCGQVCEG